MNTKYLNSLKLLLNNKVTQAIQEQYFFEGKLDNESMGTLKLNIEDNISIVFNCNSDAQTLAIYEGDFSDKESLSDQDSPYSWKLKDFLSKSELQKLGTIENIEIEYLDNKIEKKFLSGCKLDFKSGDFIYIWTQESDSIFYALNMKPPYHDNESKSFNLETIEIKKITEAN